MPLRAILTLADASDGAEPWLTDGTEAGTFLLADLLAGSGGSDPYNVLGLGRVVLFTATAAAGGAYGLWQLGAGGAVTQLVAGQAGVFDKVQWLGEIGGTALFWTNLAYPSQSLTSGDLYATDGTAAGTMLLRHFTWNGFMLPAPGMAGNDQLYFIGGDADHGNELWSTDGTVAGTTLVADTNPGSGNTLAAGFALLGGVPYFLQKQGSTTNLLNTLAGVVKTISTFSTQSPEAFLGEAGGHALFNMQSTVSGLTLWATDGTGSGTVVVKNFGAGTHLAAQLAVGLNGHQELVLRTSTGYDLWDTDGTAAGTVQLAHLFDTGLGTNYVDPSAAVLNGKLYFGTTSAAGSVLWASDGTAAGTQALAILAADGKPVLENFHTVGDHLLFALDAVFEADASTAALQGLWSSDGTAAGTRHLGPATLVDETSIAPLPIGFTSHDPDGNGRANLTWLSSDGGVLYDWQLNGPAVLAATALAGPGAGWGIKAVVDVDGDGRSDLVWRSTAGDVWAWAMQGGSLGRAFHLGQPGPDWDIVGAGDFNGDGRGDVLFYNAAQAFYWVWQLDGSGIAAQGGWGSPGADWSVLAVQDFNGDGRSDLLWQNTSGLLYLWEMDGTGIQAQGALPALVAGWAVAGTGDFNADGRADILFRNAAGSLWVWEMDGTTILDQGGPADPGANWHVLQVADYSGDGRADILAQHDNGTLWVLTMAGTTATGGGSLGPLDTAAWHLA